jgi:hypothetical protein
MTRGETPVIKSNKYHANFGEAGGDETNPGEDLNFPPRASRSGPTPFRPVTEQREKVGYAKGQVLLYNRLQGKGSYVSGAARKRDVQGVRRSSTPLKYARKI